MSWVIVQLSAQLFYPYLDCFESTMCRTSSSSRTSLELVQGPTSDFYTQSVAPHLSLSLFQGFLITLWNSALCFFFRLEKWAFSMAILATNAQCQLQDCVGSVLVSCCFLLQEWTPLPNLLGFAHSPGSLDNGLLHFVKSLWLLSVEMLVW